MEQCASLFPLSYAQSRDRFRQHLGDVRHLWPDANLNSYGLSGDEDLTIDWIEAHPRISPQHLLVLTTGEHGIEGFVGSAVLELFFRDLLCRLDPRRTGLLLVHAINPWGMSHRRRTNAYNVDLNRNFLGDGDRARGPANPDYALMHTFLNPEQPIGSWRSASASFFWGLLSQLVSLGHGRMHTATLLGQYQFPKGLFYGGAGLQQETRQLMDLFHAHLQRYDRTVLLDVHSGYGPGDQMSIVCSYLEPRPSHELSRRYSYPQVVKSEAGEFYAMHGDMIDWLYRLVDIEMPGKQLFAASLEFGTLGESVLAKARGLRALVLENRMFWHGATQQASETILHEFEESYLPSDERWRAKALADTRLALDGILRAERLLPPAEGGISET